jgi:hypothetical protein
VRIASRNPDVKPKWLVVSHLDDQYHLWHDTHKEISHNFSQVEKLERRVREIEGKMEGLEIKDDAVETRLTAMESLGRGLSGYVVQMTRTVVGQGLRLDILQRIVTPSYSSDLTVEEALVPPMSRWASERAWIRGFPFLLSLP